MAQIFGAIRPSDASSVPGLVEKMGRLQQRPSQAPATTWTDAGAGVGIGGLFSREQGRMGALDTGAGPSGIWLLDGEIYRLSAAAQHAVGAHRPASEDACPRTRVHSALSPPQSEHEPERHHLADAIPTLYAHFGSDFVSHLDGSFCVALYDAQRKTLILANDRFSTRTMYWAHTGDAFIFASELKGLLAAPFLSRALDVRTLSECFAFNRVLGSRTLFEHVRRLAPATLIEYDPHSRTLKDHAYWRAQDDVGQRLPLSADRLDGIVEAFRQSVILRTADARRVGISLSGGLDSRAIASVIAREQQPAFTCTTGIEGCADQRLAARIARVASTSHSFYALKRDLIERYGDALRTAIWLTDGMVLVGGFPAGLTQVFCDDHHIEMLLRGHGGENMRLADAWPFHVDQTVLDTGRLLPDHLQSRLWTIPPRVDWQRLFPDAATSPSVELAGTSLRELLSTFPRTLSPAETMNLLYLAENDASGPPATRNALRSHTEMGLPYLDYSFMSLIQATDARQRCGPAIHHAIIRRNAPRLMKVPNSNTGAPLDASPLRLSLTDKFNSLMRRLQLPGFRHYHYMEHWIKDFLAEEVRAIVLDKRTLSRGLYDQRYLTHLVEHGRGDASMSRLLNLIVNLEIWFRLFCDGDARVSGAAQEQDAQ